MNMADRFDIPEEATIKIKQDNPLPLTILALTVDVSMDLSNVQN